MQKSRVNKSEFFGKVVELLNRARNEIVRNVNKTMVYTYYEIGKMIVEEEQKGKNRAEYGKQLISELSDKLSKEFGKGFSSTNIKQMRSFYITYSKSQTLSDEFNLSWSHYLKLMRIDNENKTIGIILCQNKSEAIVRYTLPENNEQIFASKYQTILPSKEDLKKLIESKEFF